MRYGSVCSGIEAATVAWHPLGWEAAWYSEIEPFPCAVLKHHYPAVPNYGDMTKFQEWPDEPIDLLVGGTPCQSFSVAGLRKGLADPRGNLMLTFGAIARRYRPEWLVWENVPGVLSSNGGRDFGTFLGMLAELGYGFAYRVLDAQYFGVPQRRRRVFVCAVRGTGNWQRAAAVLFERHSLQGHSAPRQEARQGTASNTRGGVELCGPLNARDYKDPGTDGMNHNSAKMVPVSRALTDGAHMGGGLTGKTPIQGAYLPCVANPLTARMHKGINTTLDEGQTPIVTLGAGFNVAHTLRGEGYDAGEDGTGRGTPLVTVAIRTANTGANGHGVAVNAAHTLDQAQGQAVMQPIAFAKTHKPMSATDAEGWSPVDAAPTVTHWPRDRSDAGTDVAVVQPLNFYGGNRRADRPEGGFYVKAEETSKTLDAASGLNPTCSQGGTAVMQPVAFTTEQTPKFSSDAALTLTQGSPSGGGHPQCVMTTMQVRRLTPVECERLQGFPDGYTNIPWRGKRESPDGPRYKALGNSMAVPVMRWIGERIQQVSDL